MKHTCFQLTFLCCFFASISAYAQTDSLYQTPEEAQILLEDLLQSTESEADFDFNTIYESLAAFVAHPINLNKADATELGELQLLSDIQISDLINHRILYGDLISLLELQSIPSFDQETIQTILPYVSVNSDLDDYQVPIITMLAEGKNELYLRWNRTLQEQRGFTDDVSPESRFLGDPNRFYLRYKHNYENKLSYGITAEKDAGEPFFQSVNRNEGFDFYSAHLFLKNYSNTIKAVAIGDYAISLGQGLIAHSGFGYGKSNLVMNIKKSSPTLRPYSSVNEVGFMRGAGVTLGLGENIETTVFASYRSRDGNVVEVDTTDIFGDQLVGFSSLLNAGFHRNINEVEDQNAIQQFSVGGNVAYRQRNWHIGLNAIFDRFSQPLIRNTQPFNRFYFSGTQAFNASVDYSFIQRNFNFFGETAVGDNGAIATMNGLLIGVDRKIDLAILHRHYPFDYVALTGNAFGETTQVRNENGLYLGLVARPLPRWEWSGYFDVYQHPWLRSRIDAPSKGYDWRMRLRFYKKRDVEAYLQLRQEVKEQNFPDNTTPTDFIAPTRAFQARLHFSKKVTPELELRTRLDWGYTDNGVGINRSEGFNILQDVIYRPVSFPISFSTRFAIFDTDGFNTRFYHYENNLLYTFAIPAYYNRGTRFYINARYRGIRNLTIEARYEQTVWKNQDSFGSGIIEIEGNLRSAVSAQIKYKF